MEKRINDNYADPISERVILGFLLQHGSDILAEIEATLGKEDFFDEKNQSIFACIKHLLEKADIKSITVDAILTTANSLGLVHIVNKNDVDYLRFCKQQGLSVEELPEFVRNVKFWSVIRKLQGQTKNIGKYLQSLSGQESISEVVSKTESSLFDFIPSLLQEEDIIKLGSFAESHITFLSENQISSAGIPSGFPNWDYCIGGGLRRGTVNIIGGRPKSGKSFICLNIAKNVSMNNVPVLYLDTELNKEIQSCRWVALHSKVDTSKIETGQYANSDSSKKQVKDSLSKIQNLPFYHTSIVGKSPTEIMSTMRRWLRKEVKYDGNGYLNNCLIILDYLKTMDLKDMGSHQEYQYLGDVMTKLHNFAVKYDIPILAAVQLNRDGITKDTTDAVSGSDRVLWLCSSLTYLKNKTPEDIAAGDPEENGDKKLIVIETRFGHGMDSTKEYINVKTSLQHAEMIEGDFNYEIKPQTLEEFLDDEEQKEEVAHFI